MFKTSEEMKILKFHICDTKKEFFYALLKCLTDKTDTRIALSMNCCRVM